MAEEKKDKDKEGEKKENKKGGSKMILIIVGIVVLAIALGLGAFFALKGSAEKKEASASEDEESTGEDEEKGHGKKKGGHEESKDGHGEGEHGGGEHGEGKLSNALLPLDTFIVNLQVKGSFLKTTIQLEFSKPELPHEIETDTAKIRDAVIRVLSTKSAQDILTPEGKDQLREEIKTASNEALKSEDILAVYITEFIIQ